jgi:hypothetical protein
VKTRKSAGILLFATLIVIALAVGIGYARQPRQVTDSDGVYSLKAPLFASVANAESGAIDLEIGEKLDEEAGMSAYFKSPDVINLNQVRGQFRTIETETADYIIGSVPVAGYLESADPHVYVHRDGWILAYYMRSDPISKIIDAKAQSITTTKLKNVVAAMAGAAGAPFTDATYYDFRYPNATHMMLIAEHEDNGNDYTVQLPSTYGYFESGWALRTGYCCSWYFRLDGVNLPASGSDLSGVAYGSITAAQLLPDVTHTVVIYNEWAAMVVLYRVP